MYVRDILRGIRKEIRKVQTVQPLCDESRMPLVYG